MAISNWRFWGLCAGACLFSILTGCASVVHGTNQAVTIETLTADGKLIEGAECSVANDKAETVALSGSSALVRRSGGTLNIECKQAGHLPASGQATSRINGGMVGNVVLGGLVGAAIDSGTGAGFNYPSWMQLVFGEVRTFDRGAQVGEQPLEGVRVGTTALAATPSAASPAAVAPAGPVATPIAANASPTPRVSIDDLRGLLPSKP